MIPCSRDGHLIHALLDIDVQPLPPNLVALSKGHFIMLTIALFMIILLRSVTAGASDRKISA